MAHVKVGDINMHYEIHGEGEPLLIVGGLSNELEDYIRAGIVASLAKDFKVVVFDNRGAGGTDKPDIPYSVEMMAKDTKGLLDALGIARVHLVGVSMGGRIAIEFVAEYPEMVDMLVLVSTAPRVIPSLRRRITFMLLPLFRGVTGQPAYAFRRQVGASQSYDGTAHLQEIKVPTLILHGRKDSLVAYPLAEEMHEKIAGSKMMAFDGGHVFFFMQPQKFTDAVRDFLMPKVDVHQPS